MPASVASRRMVVEVGYDASQVQTGVARTQNQIQQLGGTSTVAAGGVNVLRGAIGGLATVFTVNEVSRYVGEVSRMAEQADRSRQAVIALAGGVREANAIIGGIQDAGGGGLSELDATALAARAIALGFADSEREARNFTRTVTLLGASMGKDVNTAFDEFQLILANQSYLRLDAIGISASNVRQRVAELKKEGMGIDEAFNTAVLAEAALRVDQLEKGGFEAATATEQLTAAWNDLSLALGEALSPTYQAAANGIATATRAAAEAISDSASRTDNFATAQNALRQSFQATTVDLQTLSQLQQQYNFLLSAGDAEAAETAQRALINTQAQLAQSFLANAEAMGLSRGEAANLYFDLTGLNTAYQILSSSTYVNRDAVIEYTGATSTSSSVAGVFAGALDFVAQAADAAAGGISRANAILGAFTGTMANAIGIADGLGSAILRLGAAQAAQSSGNALEFAQFNLQNAQGALDGASSIRGRINALAGVVEAQNQVANAEERIVAEKKQAATEWINSTLRQQRASERAAIGGTRAASAAAREQEKLLREQERAYEQAYNRIGGFVDRALSFRGGVQPFDDLLDRTGVGRNENATDEMIRRLEDVRDRGLEGTRSPWITEFLGLDDANLEIVAARAERLIRDLQDESKYFELIPFDQFLQDVRELEEAERRRLEFRDRAIQALGAGSTAAVDKALGLEGVSSDTGAALAENVATTLQAGIEAEQARFKAAGTLGAQYFESGFNEPLRGIVRRMLEDELNLMTQDIAA